MTANEPDGIIDAEIVEDDRLPARVEQADTYQGNAPIEAQHLTPDGRTWPHGPRPERRCVAHKKNGDQCKNASVPGATVCRYHGGAAKHVKRAARARLENAADLMAKELLGIALTAEGESVKLAAIRDALDRAGLKAPSEVVLSQGDSKPFEAVFESIGGDPEAAGFPNAASEDCGAAGIDASPAPAYDNYDGTDAHREPSSQDVPPQPAGRRRNDRERQPQRQDDGPSRRTPAPREVHITGMAAIRMANQANLDSGAMRPPLELESGHKRYRRP